MSSNLNTHRKVADAPTSNNNKLISKRKPSNESSEKVESTESTATSKKPGPFANYMHRKSDGWKHHTDNQDKGSEDPFVHEYKEFPGVTIIVRTAPNQKAFASLDPQAKTNLQGPRRKTDLPQGSSNVPEKSEHADKNDHTGTSNPTNAAKSDAPSSNANDTSTSDK